MKLYFSPGACSMAPHIVLREAGLRFDLDKVDLGKKQTANGEDYAKVNPKGSVPALRLDNGEVLTEVAVVLQYLADQKPDSGLAAKAGTMERYRLMEWLNFISSELHKQFAPLFKPNTPEETKQIQKTLLEQRFDYLTNQFADRSYAMGDKFTVADAYLFTILNWSNVFKMDMGKWPKLKDYMARIAERPAVKDAMRAEGLVK
jgi:glutathione S-transferase